MGWGWRRPRCGQEAEAVLAVGGRVGLVVLQSRTGAEAGRERSVGVVDVY